MLSPHVSAPFVVAALCCNVAVGATATVATTAEKRIFNLPCGDAAVTLKQFATAAGTPIVYLVDRVRGATTNQVSGEFTPRDALELMLANSGLEAAQDAATGAFVVSRKRSISDAPEPKGEVGPVSQLQTNKKNMSPKSTATRFTATLAAFFGATMFAQTVPAPTTANPGKEEIVELSPFVVSTNANSTGRYTSLESTSAGRVRLNIMDSSSNVSVITSEMITDVAAGRILDATKYIAGISESTLPNAQDRTNVRGFQADGHTVDGFTYGGFLSLDPAIIDRIEVVKGPNSILAPQPTSPGGTVNNATKKPQFRDFGSLSLQVGQFDTNAVNFDLNRKIDDKMAVRLVTSVRNWDNWWKDASIRSFTFMPGLTYKFSDRAQLTVQYIFTDWKSSLYLGLPIDPTSGTTTKAKIISGVPLDLSVYADDIYRTDKQHDFKLLFTADLFKGLSMRFSALYHKSSQYAPQLNTGNSTGGTGGNRDPLTGQWNYGLQYASTAPFASSPIATLPTRVFPRSGTNPRNDPRLTFLQNDYAYITENDSIKSTTLVGFAYTETRDTSVAYNISAPNFDIDAYAPVNWTQGTLNFDNRLSSRFIQSYISENIALLNNRLILNGAVAKNYYRQRTRYTVSGNSHTTGPTASLPSYGVVIKPYKDSLSFYYTYSEQSTANGPTNSVVNTNPLLTSSKQNEFGARFKFYGDKLYFTVSHFDIKQDNFSVPNPGNLTTPPPSPLLPPLFSDRTAKGWEFELRANPTKNLSIIGNYTAFKNRDPNNVEFRGTAEKTGGVLTSYTFDKETTPALEGFRIAVGIDYIGKRPGDAASGLTAASTAAKVIPNLPTFYLGSRALVNLSLAYKVNQQWSFQLNVDNLFDKDYLMASINRSMVYVGTPTNYRLTTTLKF